MEFFSDPREHKTYFLHITWIRRLVVYGLRIFLPFIMKIEHDGMEKMPLMGGLVLVANHMTNFDAFTLQVVLPRPLFFMAKSELFPPGLDPIMRRLGAFPVRRGERDQWAINHAHKVVRNGQVLGMFPEGTRNKGIGLKKAKSGSARIAIATNAPMIPLAVIGTQNVFRNFPHRARVSIKIGDPIYPRPDEDPQELIDRIMVSIATMLPHDLRGSYQRLPAGVAESKSPSGLAR